MARPDKSRVSTDAAMRARDVSRPRDARLSENTESSEAGDRPSQHNRLRGDSARGQEGSVGGREEPSGGRQDPGGSGGSSPDTS